MEAAAFADAQGSPLNIAVTINWLLCNQRGDDRAQLARLQRCLTEVARRLGFSLTWCWGRESTRHGADHVHIALHWPPWMMPDGSLLAAIERIVQPAHERAIDIQPANGRWIEYMLKGIREIDGKHLGLSRSPGWPRRQGTIEGKRCGTSANIGLAARQRRESFLHQNLHAPRSDTPTVNCKEMPMTQGFLAFPAEPRIQGAYLSEWLSGQGARKRGSRKRGWLTVRVEGEYYKESTTRSKGIYLTVSGT
jgi:hypothetical protein